MDSYHLGARPPERLWRDVRCGALRAVHHDLKSAQVTREACEQVLEVTLDGRQVVPHAAHSCPRRSLPLLADAAFDRVLNVVGQLVPTPCEELDAVVRH